MTPPAPPWTPERVAETKALCEAATPGPWLRSNEYRRLVFADTKDGSGWFTVAEIPSLKADANAAFIAAARTALPDALDEITRLQDLLQQSEFKMRLRWAWSDMRQRCSNPKSRFYSRYGGRGIRVCERWNNDFEAFVADMGPKPSPAHSVERIDNDGPYSPENCRWATRKEQNSNSTRCNFRVVGGVRMTLTQIWETRGNQAVPFDTFRGRVNRGWDIDQALGIAPPPAREEGSEG